MGREMKTVLSIYYQEQKVWPQSFAPFSQGSNIIAIDCIYQALMYLSICDMPPSGHNKT